MKKYLLVCFYSLLHNGKNHKEIIIRSLFFLVILYIFSMLWRATNFHDPAIQEQMVWYLAITELIVLSIPLVQFDIEQDIRTGDIVYQLLKPVHYMSFKIFEAIGGFIFRFFTLALLGVPFCCYLSGYLPPPTVLFASLFLAALAGLVFIIFHTTIGLTAFRLQDASPLFWIWQRSSFLFGGMLLPLDYYPGFLQSISYLLPFRALLYKPASLMLEFSAMQFFSTLSLIVSWAIVALWLANHLYGSMLRSLKVNGG